MEKPDKVPEREAQPGTPIRSATAGSMSLFPAMSSIKPSLVAHAFSKLYPASPILDRLCLTAVLELPAPALRSVSGKGDWAKVPHRLDRVRNDRFSDRHTSHTVAKRKKCLDLFVGKHSVFDLATQAQPPVLVGPAGPPNRQDPRWQLDSESLKRGPRAFEFLTGPNLDHHAHVSGQQHPIGPKSESSTPSAGTPGRFESSFLPSSRARFPDSINLGPMTRQRPLSGACFSPSAITGADLPSLFWREAACAAFFALSETRPKPKPAVIYIHTK